MQVVVPVPGEARGLVAAASDARSKRCRALVFRRQNLVHHVYRDRAVRLKEKCQHCMVKQSSDLGNAIRTVDAARGDPAQTIITPQVVGAEYVYTFFARAAYVDGH